MNILLNFSTLKSGGGENVALNFIYTLFNEFNSGSNKYVFLVAENSKIHKYLSDIGTNPIISFSRNPILRISQEIFYGSKIIKRYKIDIIYTYFGVDLLGKSVLRVMGSADSNLYFPEIDFWKDYSGFSLVKRKLIDRFRIWGLKRATAVVFENELMENRSKELFSLKETVFIKPSIMEFPIEQSKFEITIETDTKIGLFLCGWQRNKNFTLIPEIAKLLKNAGLKYHFILTAPLDNSLDHKNFVSRLKSLKVDDMVTIYGQVLKEQLPALFHKVDHVFLLSKLESFSNNIIEAWNYKRVLIISNENWARHICKESAYYVDRNSPKSISEAIMDLVTNEILYKNKVEEGLKQLRTYPTVTERTKQELDYLDYVYKNY